MVLVTVKKGETLSEQAYQIIRKAIVFHELRPGEALIEEKLSEALSISRTPLRTALRRLIDEGLADAQGKNIVVSDLTPEDVANIRQVRLTLERQSFFVQWLTIAVPLAVLFCLGILRGEYISSGFIYQQF